MKLQKELFEQYDLYYERKRGEFADGVHYGYLPSSLVLNRDKLVRVALACDYRVNQSRSSVATFFKESAIAGLLKVSDAGKYAYGYKVLDLLKKKRKSKPTVKGDRYHIKDSGQALRYGDYAVVAVSTSLGIAKSKTEPDAVDAVLSQWKTFEAWAESCLRTRLQIRVIL